MSNNTLDDGHLAAGKSSVAENLKTEVEHNSPDHARLPFAYSKKIMKLTFGFTKIMTVDVFHISPCQAHFFQKDGKLFSFLTFSSPASSWQGDRTEALDFRHIGQHCSVVDFERWNRGECYAAGTMEQVTLLQKRMLRWSEAERSCDSSSSWSFVPAWKSCP